MPRKGENIYKRKDGRWEGRFIKQRTSDVAKYGYIYGKSYLEVKKKLEFEKKCVILHPLSREKRSKALTE